MGIIKLLIEKKIRNDFFFFYLSYIFFIGFSLISQIIAVKIFSADFSKLYLFYIAIFSYGNFLGEAGFSRYDMSTKFYNQTFIYNIFGILPIAIKKNIVM